jgi:RimJ/RimL family protein N-acetyltransferase
MSRTRARREAVDAPVSFRAGGTTRAVRELEQAAHRLSQRRLRDLLPGRIATRRLVLRAPMRGDVPDLVRLADNKAIADRLARLPHPYTRADAIAFIEIIAQRPDERPYAITQNDRFIGVAGFSFAEGKPPELGFWLGEPFWGQGLMSEAVKALVEAAHATGQFDRIVACALASNAASLRVQEKAGFRRVRAGTEEGGARHGEAMVYLELEKPRWM